MISIAEARARILQQAWTNSLAQRPLTESLGLVLARDVNSDMDSPPYDKSLVDGFAVRSSDVNTLGARLDVIDRVTAGQLPKIPVRQGTAVQIMTGAPLPEDADAVVMIEQTEIGESMATSTVRIDASNVAPGQNILRRGAVMARNAVVLPAGHEVRAVDIGLLAEVGCCEVPVIAPPRVAVLATGNELVAAQQMPRVGMIRNSNGPLLCALAQAERATTSDLVIAPDQEPLLQQAIARGLQHDLLVLSGGVSAGVLDLVPRVLEQLGVTRIFHKVRLRPGKPMWFGVYRGDDGRTCLVFALPGNPVGSLVCFELFVAPVLRTLAGREPVVVQPRAGHLAVAHRHRSDRPTYHPAHAVYNPCGRLEVTPVAWRGSADQRAIGLANGLAFFPPGERQFEEGETIEIVMFAR